MRTNALLPFILFLVFALPLSGQPCRSTTYEIYGAIGYANYFGDIGGSADENTWYGIKDLDIKRSRPGIIGGVGYIPGDYLAFNGSLAMGWLSGSDLDGFTSDSSTANDIYYITSVQLVFRVPELSLRLKQLS